MLAGRTTTIGPRHNRPNEPLAVVFWAIAAVLTRCNSPFFWSDLGFTWHKKMKIKGCISLDLYKNLVFAKQFFGQEHGHPMAKSCRIWQSWCLVLVGEEVVYWYWQRISGNICFNSQILYWIGHWNTYSTWCNQWIYNWF